MKGKILKYSFMLMVCFAFVFCFMPKQSLATNNDWIYDEKAKTLTNDAGVTLINVTANGNELTVGGNSYNSNLVSIDLTGDIHDSENNEYSIIRIGSESFYKCSSLTNVILPDSITSIGVNAFGSCVSLTNITLPDSITIIDDTTFSNCKALTYIYIPNSVTKIGELAFSNCSSLTELAIPSSVTKISTGAFASCSSLNKVYITNEMPPTIEDIFISVSLDGIYVPSSSIDLYKNASGWSKYKDIIKGIYKVTVEKGSGSGNFVEGDTVNIKANDNDENGHFAYWKLTNGSGITLVDEKAKETTFTMIDSDVTITAGFEAHNYVDGKCIVCGYEDKNYVPPKDDNDENIGNNDNNNNNSNNNNNDSVSDNSTISTNNTLQTNMVKTSDNNNLTIWILMLCACVVSIVSIIVYKKRLNK